MTIARPINKPIPFANSGGKNTILVPSQSGGTASYTDGFPPATRTPLTAGGIAPAGLDMNGVLFDLSSHVVFLNAGGRYRFDAALATAIGGYPVGFVLQSNDGLSEYVNILAANTTDFNSSPSSIGVSWLPWSGAAAVSGIVADMRNAKMSVPSASVSATFAADELFVETALGGVAYKLASYSQTINLGTTGAGGMDTGAAPVSGYVALYAIYNPTTLTKSILACNAATLQGNVYGGANMPAGYTASALIGVWPTNGSGQFVVGYQNGRKVSAATVSVLNTSTQQATLTSLSISAAVPANAKTVSGGVSVVSTVSASLTSVIAGSSTSVGQQQIVGTVGTVGIGPFDDLPIITSQVMYYVATVNAGTMTLSIGISSYTF